MKLPSFLRRDADKPKPPGPTDDFWYEAITNWKKFAGEYVSPDTADQVPAFYACRTGIAECIAMCPVQVFERQANGDVKELPDSDMAELLGLRPTSYCSAFTWWEAQQNNLITTGLAYAKIERRPGGKPAALPIYQPSRMQILTPGGRLVYRYTHEDGTFEDLRPDDVLHFRMDTTDGLTGRGPLQRSAAAVAIALALQRHTGSLFENGAFFRGFVEAQHAFDNDDQRQNFLSSVLRFMKSGRIGLLEGGTKFTPATMNAENAQMDQLWKRIAISIAGNMHMPPHMIQILEDGVSYASIEQQGINFVTYTLLPWTKRHEMEVGFRLLPPNGKLFIKFNLSALLRGDLASRTTAITQQIQYGLMTVNEGRKILDLNASKEPNANTILVSHNLRPISQADQPPRPLPKEPSSEMSPLASPDAQTKSAERFRPLFQDLLGRVMRREVSEVKANRKKEAFLAWADKFYTGQLRELLRDALRSAVLAYGGSAQDLEPFIDSYIARRGGDLVAGIDPPERPEPWADNLLISLEERCQH